MQSCSSDKSAFFNEKRLIKTFPAKSNYSILFKQGFRQHFKKKHNETSIIAKFFILLKLQETIMYVVNDILISVWHATE